MTTEPRMAYVARIVGCGCIVAASVDEPRYARENAKLIAQKIRAGFVVERVSVEDARAIPWGWPCEHMKAAAEASHPLTEIIQLSIAERGHGFTVLTQGASIYEGNRHVR